MSDIRWQHDFLLLVNDGKQVLWVATRTDAVPFGS
jgi:hypothetical protein